jgi:hypothetical protein
MTTTRKKEYSAEKLVYVKPNHIVMALWCLARHTAIAALAITCYFRTTLALRWAAWQAARAMAQKKDATRSDYVHS